MKRTKKFVVALMGLTLACAPVLASCGGTDTPVTPDEKTVSSISVTKKPTKTTYKEGEKFDKTGMVVTALYSDKTSEAVTDYTIDKTGELKMADTKVTITYKEKTATVAISVKSNVTVASIVIKAQPTKLEYVEGDLFDPDGMIITATMTDGTTKDVNSGYTYDKTKGLAVADTTVTITYQEKTATVAITVTKRTDITVNALGVYKIEAEDLNTGNATLREDFVSAGRTFIEEGADASGGKNLCGYKPGSYFTINIHCDEDSTVYITSRMSDTNTNYVLKSGLKTEMDGVIVEPTNDPKFTYNGGNDYWNWVDVIYGTVNLTKGDHVFKITSVDQRPNLDFFQFEATKYNGLSEDKVLTGIRIATQPTKVAYEVGDKFDATGLVVKAVYSTKEEEVITDYTLDKADVELTEADTKIIVTYETFTAEIAITVGKVYPLKLNALGDNVFEAEDLTPDDKWILRTDMAGQTTYTVTSSESSGGKSIERYEVGTVMTLPFYVSEDSKIHFTSIVSNYDEIVLNDTVEFKIDETLLTSNNPTLGHRHGSDWWNWKTADFGTVELAKGEHTLTINMKSARPNLDAFNFHVMKLGTAEEPHTVKALNVKTQPTKTSYTEGETFDGTGLTLEVAYNDSMNEVVTEGFTFDKTGALTTEDTKVVVTYGELTVEVAITVAPLIQLALDSVGSHKFEAESLVPNDAWIWRSDMGEKTTYVIDNAEASGAKSIERYAVGTVMTMKFSVAEASKLHLSSVMSDSKSYSLEGNVDFKIDDTALTYDINPTLGSSTASTYYNWKTAWFNEVELAAGTHVLTITMTKERPNLDCFDFHMTKMGETVEDHNLSSISIASAPTKVDYYEGDTLDLTGLKLMASYTDTAIEEVTTGYTVDKTAALTAEDKVVTITYNELTVTFNINVVASADIEVIADAVDKKLEGEEMDTTHMTNNGNSSFVETSNVDSTIKCLGNGTSGYANFYYNLSKEMNLDMTAAIAKAEDLLVINQFKMFVDDVEIDLLDPTIKLGGAEGNSYFNFKSCAYTQVKLAAGKHKVQMKIIGCNVDYLDLNFTKVTA
jgi:hypothetical protein